MARRVPSCRQQWPRDTTPQSLWGPGVYGPGCLWGRSAGSPESSQYPQVPGNAPHLHSIHRPVPCPMWLLAAGPLGAGEGGRVRHRAPSAQKASRSLCLGQSRLADAWPWLTPALCRGLKPGPLGQEAPNNLPLSPGNFHFPGPGLPGLPGLPGRANQRAATRDCPLQEVQHSLAPSGLHLPSLPAGLPAPPPVPH